MPKDTNESNETTHMKLELKLSQNADAIGVLTKTVNILAKTIGEESKANMHIVNELRNTSKECTLKFAHMIEKMDTKKVRIDKLEEIVHELETNKVDKVEFGKVNTRLWTIGGTVMMAVVGALSFMIKLYIEKGAN